MKNILWLSRAAMQYRNEMVKPYGLCGVDCQYLFYICKNEGCTQDMIASGLYIDKSNVARKMTDLEAKDLIYRKQMQDDRRNLQVYPTEKAKELMPQIKKIVKAWNDYITEDLTEEEELLFDHILRKIRLKTEAWRDHHFTFEEENQQ